jgi:2-haloacid dehalogenase
MTTACEAEFPGRGGEVVALWRSRQFEYARLRTVSNRPADFTRVTEDSLSFAAKALRLDLSADKRQRLAKAHFALKAWPEVASSLAKLKEPGFRLALLSKFTSDMLSGCVEAAGLGGLFGSLLSTGCGLKTYKPDPRAYQLRLEALDLSREGVLFAPFAGWDAAGGKAFGYRTFWVNRLDLPPEELDIRPDGVGGDRNDRDLLELSLVG